MRRVFRSLLPFAGLLLPALCAAQSSNLPRWWAKYQYLTKNAPAGAVTSGGSVMAGPNVDVSNECGPQSETFIAIDHSSQRLAGGSNEIFRLPMRGYASTNGASWSGVDLPLPPPQGTNGTRFGSDPSLAFDTRGNVFYSYIVVFFGNGKGNSVTGTEIAVARSTDGGKTYPAATYFNSSSGSDHFNDKPMITTDTNPASPYRDNIYVAWDAATGGSSGGGILLARSADYGVTFTTRRIDSANGPGRSIGAQPFVGPNGEVYAAWNDYDASAIVVNKSLDGGLTWGTPVTIATQHIGFQIAVPAQASRGALVYPACDADRSTGAGRGTLYCSWIDLKSNGTTDIFVSRSKDGGATWSAPAAVADQLGRPVDRFNHWMAVDAATGDVALSFYDTRNDTSGSRYATDIYFTELTSKSAAWLSPNVRVSSESSNEHDCGGVTPCAAINSGNQYGDYSGLAAFGGASYPFWTDSRRNGLTSPGCRTGLAMEEVFFAIVN